VKMQLPDGALRADWLPRLFAMRDEVLARLLALNQERAKEEAWDWSFPGDAFLASRGRSRPLRPPPQEGTVLSSRRMRVSTVVSFPVSTGVRRAILGTRAPVRVGRRRGILAMPRAPRVVKPFSNLLPPRVAGIRHASQVAAESFGQDGGLLWGRPSQTDGNRVVAASVTSALLVFDMKGRATDSELRRRAEGLSAIVNEWMNRFVTWLEVVSGQDLGTEPPLREHRSQSMPFGARIWTALEEHRRSLVFVNPTLVAMGMTYDAAISASAWRRCVAATNAGTDPPETWILLRDAKRALRRGRYRQAVLDAATMTELVVNGIVAPRVLTNQMGKKLAQTTLSDSKRRFGFRLKLLEQSKARLDRRIKTELVELRNKVIHEHKRPTPAEAQVAVAHAASLVSRFVPRGW